VGGVHGTNPHIEARLILSASMLPVSSDSSAAQTFSTRFVTAKSMWLKSVEKLNRRAVRRRRNNMELLLLVVVLFVAGAFLPPNHDIIFRR
jgi:hypothetical protein